MADQNLVPLERVERSILILRGHRVILDSDLADLYGVPVKRLNEQVKRNIDRFPDDFAFTLTEEGNGVLGSQFATLKTGRGEHRKYLSRAFTERRAIVTGQRCRGRDCRECRSAPKRSSSQCLPRVFFFGRSASGFTVREEVA